MKFCNFLLLFILFYNTLLAQDTRLHPVDNNPKLSAEEAAWFNQHIKTDSFNFAGKYVGFAKLLSGMFYGIGKLLLPSTKKSFFEDRPDDHIYKLYILNAEEKKGTNGFDAIVVVASNKIKGKMRRLEREDVLANIHNRYPQIPADAGLDSNALLSSVNADFFNELYKYDNRLTAPFDFSGKKLAIFAADCNETKPAQISIPQYVNYVKKRLDADGYCSTENTYILTEQQKKDTGGYDVIIQFRCKTGGGVERVVKELNRREL